MRIVIIGNGISGITAAKTLRQLSDHEIIVISDESELFFSRTALMYVFMGHMRVQDIVPHPKSFYEQHNIKLHFGRVNTVQFEHKQVEFNDNHTLAYDKLIIATGSKPTMYGWPGSHLDGVHNLYHLQDLENIERHAETCKHAVIVGGGLIGIELAEMLHSRAIQVTMLVRESGYWNNVLPAEESEILNKHISEQGIDLQLQTELKEIWGDKEKVKMILTSNGAKINTQLVGITTGVQPNISFLDFTSIEKNRGLLTNSFLETSIPDVYAIGDCAELRNPTKGRKAVEPVWYTGRMMGELVAHNILGAQKAYDPGIWFNSAKFFDIEYQVYGFVPNQEMPGIKHIFWKHPSKNKSIRLVYEEKTGTILGFNLLGIRYRQEVCEKWIAEETSIETVLQNLSLANFDPEFFKSYEKHLVHIYNEQSGAKLKLQSNGRLSQVLTFLKHS